jgi:hypothetical protein
MERCGEHAEAGGRVHVARFPGGDSGRVESHDLRVPLMYGRETARVGTVEVVLAKLRHGQARYPAGVDTRMHNVIKVPNVEVC